MLDRLAILAAFTALPTLAAAQADTPFTLPDLPYAADALAPAITAPTLVISGSQDLVSPTRVAREVAGRIPGAQLLEIRGAGHSMLDTRSRILQIAARWSACGVAHRLPEHAAELAALPVSATDRALSRGLQIALAAERHSPWRLRLESARAERERHLLERAQATSRGQRGRRTGRPARPGRAGRARARHRARSAGRTRRRRRSRRAPAR